MNAQPDSYDDRQDHIPSLSLPDIDVFRNVYQGSDYRVDFEIPEFTAVCPKTGLPDFGIFYISYKPDEFCLELKSLKEYFTAYRGVGIFHENVVNRVRDDIVRACAPLWLRIHADYNVRGGIKTRVSTAYHRPASTERKPST